MKRTIMRRLYTLALFLSALIMSIPVVHAQELNIQKFQGKDNAKGYAKVEDQITIEVLVKIPGEEVISKEQVRLYVEDSYAFFDTCVAEGTAGFFKCTFFESEFEAYEPIVFTIELRDDDDNIVGSETRTLIIDNIAPEIKEFTVDPPISSGNIQISYVAEDYGLTYGTAAECSGIKTITINAGAQAITDSAEPGTCSKDNIIDMTIEQSGKKQICVAAKDYLNFASAPKCFEVRIDKAPPEIESVSILDEQGFVLTHVHTGEERTSTVSALITDDGEVDQSTVYALLAQLNPNLPEPIPPDNIAGDIYSWAGIPVVEVNPCKLTITAKDSLGNDANKDFDCTIKADDTPPTITGLISETERDGVPLYGYGTQLIIEIEDKDNTGAPGIGMLAKKAYLDLSKLGMDDFLQADTCARISPGVYRCTWLLNPPLTVDEGPYTITVSEGTSDDLDNMIGSPVPYEIIYDNTGPKPPQIMDFKVISGESGVEYQGGAVRGDYVQYVVRSGEFITALANFKEIGGSEETTPTTCADVANTTQDCTFEAVVDLSGPYTSHLDFSFFDDAKNKASVNTTLEIYGIDNETKAKYWKTPPTVTCSPPVIYRDTAALIPQLAACRIDLETPRTDITTLAIAGPQSPDECKGDVALNINDLYMINTAEGSTHPYLFMKLEPKIFYVNDLKINCPIQVFSKRAVKAGGETHYYVSSQPQTVPANITILFGTSPLGLLNQNIDDKIEKAFKEGLADWEWISDLRKILYYGELLCQLKVMITSVLGALFLVTVLLGACETALKATGFGAPAGQACGSAKIGTCNTEETGAKAYEGILPFIDAICSIINCASTGTKKGGDVLNYVGGGVPWCQDIKAIFNKYGGGDILGAVGQESGMAGVTVKDSLVLSLLCLCLPGIIYNLDKWRQVDCFKSVCLHDYVKLEGYPESFCEEMHGYLLCTFILGQVFALLPFVKFFDSVIQIVLDVITDPAAAFTLLIGAVCTTGCYTEGSFEFAFCATAKILSTIGEAVGSVKAMTNSENEFGKPVGSEMCDRMDEIKDEMDAAGAV